MFSKEFYKNRAFTQHPLANDEFYRSDRQGIQSHEGIEYLEDGSIKLRLYAPETKAIRICINYKEYMDMEKQHDGWFEKLIEYDDNKNGPLAIDMYYDGVRLLSPYMPTYFSANSLHNYAEFPDFNQEFSYFRDVPHGAVTHQYYYSSLRDNYERCLVYTPPGYMNGTDSYPVLYLQHGGGENETVWDSTGRIACIMDNLIAEGKCVPFIIVMNNDMLRRPGNEAGPFDHGFENMLINDCIPFIDSHFRTKNDKWNRAIGGLSMGSFLSNDIALFHPDKFAYFCALTGCMHQRPEMAEYVRPYTDEEKMGEIVKNNYRVFFQSFTPQEDRPDGCMADNKTCIDNGVAEMPGYRFIIHEPRTTKWCSWRMGIRDFAKLIFRESEAYESAEALKKYDI